MGSRVSLYIPKLSSQPLILFMSSITHLVVGLGNPGAEYERTRHNIGFMVADALADLYRCPAWKRKFKGVLTTSPSDPAFLLLKPHTFMNVSGESVVEALNFYKLAPKDVIVFHDDLALEPAQVKIKQGGGHAGHNGLKSLDAHIGVDYWRVRLGIGHPGTHGDAVTHYVLNSFAKAEHVWIDPLLKTLASGFDFMLTGKAEAYLKHIKADMHEALLRK